MGLITLNEYKASHVLDHAAIDGPYTDDELQAFIDSASDTFESDCYQSIGASSETEVIEIGTWHCAVDRRGMMLITPRFYPITAVSSIKYRSLPQTDWDDATEFTSTDWSIQDIASNRNYSWGAQVRIPFVNPFRRGDWGEIQIAYDYGYADIPGDVKEAITIATLAYASMGMAAVVYSPNDSGQSGAGPPNSFVPSWAWSRYNKTVQRYRRNV